MTKFNKKQAILIGLTLALGLGLLGCGRGPGGDSNQNTNVNLNQNANLNTNAATGEIDTSDWQTYRNEEYGFEFRYPPTLFTKKSNYYDSVLFDKSLNINIDILNKRLDPETIESPIGIVKAESLEKINVGGRLAYRFKDGDAGYGGNSYRIYLDSGHTLFVWFVTNGGGYFTDEEKIMSTFKFRD